METEEEGEAREPESRTMGLHRIARHGQMMEGGNLEDEEADREEYSVGGGGR